MYGQVVFSDPQPDLRTNGSFSPVAPPRTEQTDAAFAADGGGLRVRFGMKLVGSVSLHNRPWLQNELRRELSAVEGPTDDEITLAAYAKWGERCAERLEGEFAFAIWDSATRHLFCCRDQMGARPFFYYSDSSRFVLADDPQPILAQAGIPRKLNLPKLATVGIPLGLKMFPEDTFHAGVRALPPGAWMRVDRSGIRRQTYWQPEIRDDLAPRAESEIFETLGALLRQAVESRVAGCKTPAALFSGGLDSSAVVSIAGRYLTMKNRSLTALAAVLPENAARHLTDEREYIDQFRGYPGVRLEHVSAVDGGPFDAIETPAEFQGTFLRVSRMYLYDALEAAALARGADCLFHGEGGEFGPTNWGRPFYAQLAMTGRWVALAKELKAARPVAPVSPARVLVSQLLGLLFPRRQFQPFALLQSDFLRSTQVPRPSQRIWPAMPDQRLQQRTEIRGWLARSAIRVSHRWPRPIRTCYPLMDKRVLEFCLSVPPKYKVKNGYSRYLVRQALDGILPPRIQWRTSKCPFSPDYFIRYNSQLGKAREFVDAIRPSDPVREIVDVGKLKELLGRPPVAAGDAAALGMIPTTIYLICFLRQFSEFRL